MFNIFTHRIVFELCLMKKEEEEEEERRKKMNKIEFFKFGFSRLC